MTKPQSPLPVNGLTPWFPAHITPVRKGVYEVAESGGPAYAYWDGKRFGFRCWTYPFDTDEYSPIDSAYENRLLGTGLDPRIAWRGLARKP